jgi:hypothetical protein
MKCLNDETASRNMWRLLLFLLPLFLKGRLFTSCYLLENQKYNC